MLEKKEKAVMSYLSEICLTKKTYLVSAEQIATTLSKKYLLSISEIDDIMVTLNKDNYLDFVAMDAKKGYYYCVNLKNKGLTYAKDQQKAKKELLWLILRTLCLTLLSFLIGVVLRTIFKG